MTRATLDSDQRLTLIIQAQREIAAADGDLQTVMQVIAERLQAIIGADGAMVSLIDGENLHRRGVSGIASAALDAVRPISSSVARYAIQSGQPLLIENAPQDPRVNQELRAKVGDESLICVPLRNGAEVIGTLNVMSRDCNQRLTDDDREVLEVLSVVLSAAVARAAQLDARQEEAKALTRFRALFEGASVGIVRMNREGATCAVAMIEDITEHKRAERELIEQAALNEYHALHDPLTGLPNRVLFGERIAQTIRHARRKHTQMAVLLMDLDRFKEVNDSLGHPAGDQLLIEVTDRIRGAIRDLPRQRRGGAGADPARRRRHVRGQARQRVGVFL